MQSRKRNCISRSFKNLSKIGSRVFFKRCPWNSNSVICFLLKKLSKLWGNCLYTATIMDISQILNGQPYTMSSRCRKTETQSRLSRLNGSRLMMVTIWLVDFGLCCQTVRNRPDSSPATNTSKTCSDVIYNSLSSGLMGQHTDKILVNSIFSTPTAQRVHRYVPMTNIILPQTACLETKRTSSAFMV